MCSSDLERFIEAQIFMPYVQDEVIEELRASVKALDREVVQLKSRNIQLAGHIKYLEKPWYKKVYLALECHFK